MHRYLPFVLLFVSIAFLLHPVPEMLGAAQPTPPPPAKKQTATATATKPGKKTMAVAPVSPAAKTNPAHQPARPTHLTAKAAVAAPPTAKPQQAASRRDPAKPDSAATAMTQVRRSKQAPPARVAAPDKPAAAVAQRATARKKPAPPRAAASVSARAPVAAPVEMDKQISSRSAIVLDARTGAELFTKSPDNPRQPASTIKIVTAMIALKSLKNDDVIDVSNHAAGMPSSKVFLEPSKHYQANDLINAVLLASANDASVALAEKIAGSEDNFANLMTLSARMWGARNTICRTASGLTALGQQSTARDLATLFRYAMQHDEFARRMHEKFIATSYGKVLRNHNKALWRLDGAIGGKTGYTVAARQTYVGQFSRDNQTIVVAIMGSESMWADLEKLVNYGFRKQKEEQLARIGSESATGKATRVN